MKRWALAATVTLLPCTAAPLDSTSLLPEGDLIEADVFRRLDEAGVPSAAVPPAEQARSATASADKPPASGVNTTGSFRLATLWRTEHEGVDFDDRSKRLTFSVCWINPDAQFVEGIEITERAVFDTWATVAPIRFDFFECNDRRPSAIRILIDESGPRSYVGNEADGANATMFLNFGFQSWSPSCRRQGGALHWQNCVHSIAVHEFGHALGFQHEHDRLFYDSAFHKLSDAELAQMIGACAERFIAGPTAPQMDDVAGTVSTQYDPQSVMNYCFDIYDHKVALTEFDIQTVNQMYGSPQ